MLHFIDQTVPACKGWPVPDEDGDKRPVSALKSSSLANSSDARPVRLEDSSEPARRTSHGSFARASLNLTALLRKTARTLAARPHLAIDPTRFPVTMLTGFFVRSVKEDVDMVNNDMVKYGMKWN